MKPGFLPSQQRFLRRAFKKAEAFDQFRRRTRRNFIALGVGGLGLAAVSFVAGRSLASSPAASLGEGVASPLLQTARTLASADDGALLQGAHTIMLGLDAAPSDPVLHMAATRLARLVLTMPLDDSRQRIGRHVLATLERIGPSDTMQPLLDQLRERVR